MLPFINLQLGEIRSFDVQQGAPGLLPEGADVLEGDFSDILHLRVAAGDGNPEAGGDFLQPDGTELPLLPLRSFDNALKASDGFNPSDKFLHIGPVPLQNAGIEQAADALASLTPDDGSDAAQVIIPNAELTQSLPDDVTPELPPAASMNPVLPIPTRPTASLDDVVPASQRAVGTAISDRNDLVPDRAIRATAPDPATLEASRQLLAQRSAEAAPVVNGAQVTANQALENRRNLSPVHSAADRHSGEPAPFAVEANDRKPGSEARPFPAPGAIFIDDAPRSLREDVAFLPRPQTVAAQHLGPSTGESTLIVDHGPRSITDAGTAPPRLASAQLVSTPVNLPVQDSGWDQVISERVLMMANGRLQNAEIRLTPAELGPLKIQVAIEDGTANVAFQAQHAVTREAIELAMPRLRELMAENGLTLGQANVSDEGVDQSGRDGAHGAPAGNGETGEDSESQDVTTPSVNARVSDGLVDTFA